MNLVSLAMFAAIVVITLSSFNWRLSVKTVLVIVVLEGALRKWALPQASQLIYFLKDFVLIGAYFSYFTNSKPQNRFYAKDETIKGLVYLVALWCFLEIFNPGLGSPVIGIFGMRNYLIYVPLMWMIPSLFRSEQELYKFLRHYLLLIIPVGLLAIAQYFSPPDSFLNVYAGDAEQSIAMAGDAVRVTGTFSYLAGYSTYLGVCFSLLLPLILKPQTSVWRCLTIVELSLIAITSFMTGARGLMLFLILAIAGYIFLEGWRDLSSLMKSLNKLIVPTVVASFLLFGKFSTAISSFESRGFNSESLLPRIFGELLQPVANFQYALFSGYGIGATFQANGAIRSLFHLPPGEYIPVLYEGEMGRVALELGMIGFFAWYALKIFLLIALWNTYKQLKKSFFRQLAVSIFLFQAINITNQFVFNHSANVYFWFMSGFVFLLPQLERIEGYRQNFYLRQSKKHSFQANPRS